LQSRSRELWVRQLVIQYYRRRRFLQYNFMDPGCGGGGIISYGGAAPPPPPPAGAGAGSILYRLRVI